MAIPLFTLGLLSMLGQVVLLRELSVASYGIELVYLLALGFWLFGTGVGSSLARRSEISSAAPIYLLLILIAVILPLDVVFVRGLRVWFGGVRGAYLPFPLQLLGIALSLLPATIPMGLLFPWAAAFSAREGKTIASAYAIESAGAVVGGIASTGLLRIGMPNLTVGFLCALLAALTALLLLWRDRSRRWLFVSSLFVSVLLVLALLRSGELDRQTTGWNHPHLLLTKDTPYGRVSVTRQNRQVSVYENDALSFETEGTSAEEFVHPAMLAHSQPLTVLILGSGLEGTIREALQHAPQRIDYIEINGVLLSELLPLLPNHGMDTRRGVHVQVADPRRALQSMGQYDVILNGMPDPTSAQSNRYYTEEFFELVQSHLRDGGVFAFRLRSAENFWAAPLALRNTSIIEALKGSFSDVIVLPGATNVILAGKVRLPHDPEMFRERFLERGLSTRLVTPEYLRYLLTNDRFTEIRERLSEEQAPANTDARPVCFSYATTIWLSKFAPRLLTMRFVAGKTFAQQQWIAVGLIAMILAAIALIARAKPSIRLVMLAGIAGFCGMLLETVLIFRYQIQTGVLYQNIGLLLTLFMLGLTLGASAMARIARRTDSFHKQRQRGFRATGLALVAALALTSCVAAWLMNADRLTSLEMTGVFLGLTGFLVAAVFVYTMLGTGQDAARSVSRLYAADLIGGGIGSLLGTLLWIPLAGLPATVWLAVIVCIFGGLLV
ncbi:hypothetical protein KKH27_10580 [bacterium]|nr:hypothetical protein [bacterium]MBU1984101.1 hypothetical protein [bacterium]